MSPTERTLAYLRKQDYLVRVVEHWNPFAKRRIDLWGFDILALKGSTTLAVQCTSRSNVSARVKKIAGSEAVRWLRDAGWVLEVWGWKKGDREPRIVDVS